MRANLTFALTVMLAGGASAQTATPNTPAAAPDPSQKVICVRTQADTGSHFGASKVCHTESEWAMIRSQSTRMLEQYDTLQNKQVMPSGGR
ncbi:MAG TPA: hypothetical protein VFI23_03695 [Rhizomicrobium sp.]|nr:hypothetical protein [Rhizomicrobium sp.]